MTTHELQQTLEVAYLEPAIGEQDHRGRRAAVSLGGNMIGRTRPLGTQDLALPSSDG